MTANELRERLEPLVDQMSVVDVLYALSGICDLKADHLSSNWQDEHAAQVWSNTAVRLAKLANRTSV